MQGGRARRDGSSALSALISAALAVAVLAGCGGKDSGTKSGATTESTRSASNGQNVRVDVERACRLLTKAEVESAIGTSVKSPEKGTGAESCTFAVSASAGSVLIFSSESDTNATKFNEYARAPSRSVETLRGVGDRAFVVSGQAYVLKGSVLVAILVNINQPEPKINQAAKQLAQLAAGRI